MHCSLNGYGEKGSQWGRGEIGNSRPTLSAVAQGSKEGHTATWFPSFLISMMALTDGAQHIAGGVLAQDICFPAVVSWRKDQTLPKSTVHLRQLLPDISWQQRTATLTMLGTPLPFLRQCLLIFPWEGTFWSVMMPVLLLRIVSVFGGTQEPGTTWPPHAWYLPGACSSLTEWWAPN